MAKRPFWSYWLHDWRTGWAHDISKPLHRFYAYLDMIFIDHGYTRYLYPNSAWLSEKAYRQNHPPPLFVKKAAKRGIKTVVNLRGENLFGSNLLSAEACEKYDLKLIYFRALSRQAPTKEMIHAAKDLFNQIEYPVMFHCKSGADRAGLMSALYVLLHEGRPVEEAQKELSWKFGHFKKARTGVLDYFFETYRQARDTSGIEFMTWVDEVYDPKAMQKAFRADPGSSFLVDQILHRE